MRAFRLLLLHEIRLLLIAPGTYVVAVLFLLCLGFLFQGMVGTYQQEPQEETPTVLFFSVFWLPGFFVVPLLTMRTLAEERRLGTLETLLTAPVSAGAVVLAKFGAVYLLYASLWLATLAYPLSLAQLTGDPRIAEAGPLVGGYLFLLVTGGWFVALGILASSLCRTQLVAAILAFATLFGLVVGLRWADDRLRGLGAAGEAYRTWIEPIEFFHHADAFARGVIDSRPLLFYATGTLLALLLAVLTVESRRVRR